MTVSIIYNPKATGFNKSVLLEAYYVFESQGFHVKLIESKKPKDVIDIVKKENDHCDLIVSLGGDGTLGEAFYSFGKIKQKADYIHIPTGAANDSADNLELYKGKPKASLRLYKNIDTCEKVDVDLLSVNDVPFAYVSCFGAFTDLTYKTPSFFKKSFGKLGYYVFSAMTLATETPNILSKPIDIVYKKGDNLIQTKALTLIVSNSKTFAGFNLYKEAEITDGIFEVTILKSLPVKKLAEFTYALFYKGGENFDVEKYPEFIDSFKTDYFIASFLDGGNFSFNHDGDKAEVDVSNQVVEYKCLNKVKMLLPTRAK